MNCCPTRPHWMHAATIFECYTQTLSYHLAFAQLYGELAIDALTSGDLESADLFIHKATRHAWAHIFAEES